ncbi:MAG: hypothetical protein ACJ76V_15660 [Thermoleophilaceae bacterium]
MGIRNDQLEEPLAESQRGCAQLDRRPSLCLLERNWHFEPCFRETDIDTCATLPPLAAHAPSLAVPRRRCVRETLAELVTIFELGTHVAFTPLGGGAGGSVPVPVSVAMAGAPVMAASATLAVRRDSSLRIIGTSWTPKSNATLVVVIR